jgi:cobalt-zinc-cadmium efflux system membrane fusion protein
MRHSISKFRPDKRVTVLSTAAVVAIAVIAVTTYLALHGNTATAAATSAASQSAAEPSLQLTDAQLGSIKVGPVAAHDFPIQREAVGNIDFNEDMETQVFPPYPGRIVQLFAKLGDNVSKGQVLFTIQSPDLIQAESNLIGAAAALDQTTSALERAKKLYAVHGIDQNDYETAVANQQTAEGALKAARNDVEVFGKSQAEIDRMVKTRTIDPYLVVQSPVSGRVTARNAAPGVFVQPGNVPAPYSVADISRVWMNASVTESDMPVVHKGQEIHVSVMAFKDRTFEGRISTVGSTVDPQLHRGLVRAEIEDPKHELLPGMFASFVIVTGDPIKAPAVPFNGVVREGNGTMTVWVTTDGHHFTRRTVKLGLHSSGYHQVLDGVRLGEQVVITGAVFLDVLANGGGES